MQAPAPLSDPSQPSKRSPAFPVSWLVFRLRGGYFAIGTWVVAEVFALLTIRDLHVELGGNHILRGVTADIPRGKITALIGPNGSGKTTLLRTLLKENNEQ